MIGKRTERWLIIGLTLLAFGLRAWQLADHPPGWRDDELINSLVISQKALNGDLSVYYADASGHEALYHWLNGIMLGLFGANFLGIRLLSTFLGTMAVPLTWLIGRRWLGKGPALLAAAGLTVSFWSLMYSRFGLRHILTPLLVLGAFYFFWRGWQRGGWRGYLFAALGMGLGFYTYFAGRGVPLILIAFIGFIFLLQPRAVWARKAPLAGMFVLAAATAVPLLLVLGAQPESEARVAELAVPIIAAREGDFAPLVEYTVITLSMFHSRGDNEFLYNIPDRPLFAPAAAILFWVGVLLVLVELLRAVWDRLQQLRGRETTDFLLPERQQGGIFLFFWWLAGISPGFISVPPASLGHTILAQPATYLLLAWPFAAANKRLQGRRWAGPVLTAAALILLSGIAARDFTDYFQEWPQRGMVRFLYRADIQDVAEFVNESDLTDFGITGLMAGPWDRVALSIDLGEETAVRPRWYNPERALLLQPPLSFSGYPDVPAAYADGLQPVSPRQRAGAYRLFEADWPLAETTPVCFDNGLCAISAAYDTQTGLLHLGWEVREPLQLPPLPLISNPPPPGVYSGPRLAVFAQLLAADGAFITGDDGFWVDPLTLQVGDRFVQQHRLPTDESAAMIHFGLYDPFDGGRILTTAGDDLFRCRWVNDEGNDAETDC